ncbi:hypothetical protein GJ744_008039 [Endocarpon pusillum]|uniref:Uncharacterized protein n=1 Tax=Endocarpon pusillum TaxID=364733 RepID=A0A8H7ALX6_9EURO|nr:hypothetical protein GJ744_008039 [Endocarpon pusillum]
MDLSPICCAVMERLSEREKMLPRLITVDIMEAGLTVRNLKVGAGNTGALRVLVREERSRLAPCPIRAHAESPLVAIGEMEIKSSSMFLTRQGQT